MLGSKLEAWQLTLTCGTKVGILILGSTTGLTGPVRVLTSDGTLPQTLRNPLVISQIHGTPHLRDQGILPQTLRVVQDPLGTPAHLEPDGPDPTSRTVPETLQVPPELLARTRSVFPMGSHSEKTQIPQKTQRLRRLKFQERNESFWT